MFSARIPRLLASNALARARARMGPIPHDLTLANPTSAGISYPPDLLDALAAPAGLVYDPEPLGLMAARESVAAELERLGRPVDPARILLTASTSEAYSLLFKALGDPRDEVLVPTPSYPLFEHLARLEGLEPRAYRLDPRDDWRPELGEAAGARVRALVVVNPNNPTGSYVDPDPPATFCARSELALIADEVFFDCPLALPRTARSFMEEERCLTFTLGGLSKYLGLPQLKLAWTVVSGPEALVNQALERLEFIADQYLSVATPVQLALPTLFERGRAVRKGILERCVANLAWAGTGTKGVPVSLVCPAGGFTLVLRYPNVVGEEELALELLERDGVAVHPGYFYDFAEPGYLAVSLLVEPHRFTAGFDKLLARIATHL